MSKNPFNEAEERVREELEASDSIQLPAEVKIVRGNEVWVTIHWPDRTFYNGYEHEALASLLKRAPCAISVELVQYCVAAECHGKYNKAVGLFRGYHVCQKHLDLEPEYDALMAKIDRGSRDKRADPGRTMISIEEIKEMKVGQTLWLPPSHRRWEDGKVGAEAFPQAERCRFLGYNAFDDEVVLGFSEMECIPGDLLGEVKDRRSRDTVYLLEYQALEGLLEVIDEQIRKIQREWDDRKKLFACWLDRKARLIQYLESLQESCEKCGKEIVPQPPEKVKP